MSHESFLKVVVGEHAQSPDQRIRQQAFEQAAEKLESLTQAEVPEIFRNCGLFWNEHTDGFRDLTGSELQILRSCAILLRRMGRSS